MLVLIPAKDTTHYRNFVWKFAPANGYKEKPRCVLVTSLDFEDKSPPGLFCLHTEFLIHLRNSKIDCRRQGILVLQNAGSKVAGGEGGEKVRARREDNDWKPTISN